MCRNHLWQVQVRILEFWQPRFIVITTIDHMSGSFVTRDCVTGWATPSFICNFTQSHLRRHAPCTHTPSQSSVWNWPYVRQWFRLLDKSSPNKPQDNSRKPPHSSASRKTASSSPVIPPTLLAGSYTAPPRTSYNEWTLNGNTTQRAALSEFHIRNVSFCQTK